jgi:transposase InsO family protein
VHREDVRRSALAEVKVMIEDFRQDYNRCRPHRAHGIVTPAAFRAGWETAHEAAPASACRGSL